ncbi:MAG: hypothetical protein ABSF63_09335 [Candidatus Bathyarchaeia archaeon]|jgi:hypothetical protein
MIKQDEIIIIATLRQRLRTTLSIALLLWPILNAESHANPATATTINLARARIDDRISVDHLG